MRSLGAVVIGGYINGLGIIRALAHRKIPTALITTQPYDIAQYSRHVCTHISLLETDVQPERLVELLEQRASNWAGWALFPTTDGAIAALARHRDRLSSHYRVIAPPWEVARYFLDKQLMLETAHAVRIESPRCYGPAEMATGKLADLRFPVIVKPVVGYQFFSQFGCKLFVAHDGAELSRCIARVEAAKIPCRVFDVVPGPDNRIYAYCTYMDAYGEPSGGLTIQKIRQSPPFFGVARAAEVVADQPTLREATIALLRRIGYRGIAVAEFKLDERDGSFRFMEVNGRSVIYNGLLRRAGLDLAGMAWTDYMCGQPEPARPNGWGGAWINLHADILYSALYRRHDRVRFADFIAPYTRPIVEAVWSARDPVPFLTQWSRTLREGASALFHGRFHKLLTDRNRPPDTGV